MQDVTVILLDATNE